jgi:endonuclease/exonuclease/phosphatase (EEP) superfamily protein YafD
MKASNLSASGGLMQKLNPLIFYMRINSRFIIILFLSVLGCVHIPDTLTVENRAEKMNSRKAENLCTPELETSPPVFTPPGNEGLSTSGFGLLSWNIQKENRSGWKADFVRLSLEADILIIQEAFLTEELRQLLNSRSFYWHLVTAFEYRGTKTGVLTASMVEPDFICPLRVAEPLIRFPKTILITRYPLADTHKSLMVANIHMINFAPHLASFREQANQMLEILVNHEGPMILSGDFNTWSEERLVIIEDMAGQLQLESASFKNDPARKVFGSILDRVYYRGLKLDEAVVIEVNSSDHNPLRVRFRLDDEG